MQAKNFFVFSFAFVLYDFIRDFFFSVGDFVSAFWFYYLTHKPNVWLLPVDDEFRIYIFFFRNENLLLILFTWIQNTWNRGAPIEVYHAIFFLFIFMAQKWSTYRHCLVDAWKIIKNILHNMTYGWLLTVYTSVYIICAINWFEFWIVRFWQ